jgi:two-component system, cell cycle sensor histidine kinase and response regulator CckA
MPAEAILVADDEATVRAYIRMILKMEGFELLEAADGLDALHQVQQRGAPVDLLLTDIRMPRMDGIRLASAITDIYPKTPVLYTSGYPPDFEQEQRTHPTNACAFLSKPFSRNALLDAVRKCLRSPEAAPGATL